MKHLYSLRPCKALLLLLLLTFGMGKLESIACNQTYTTLVSVVESGNDYIATIELCIGAGVTGVNQGADGDTYDMAFGFYMANGASLTISSFTPTITSSFTGCEIGGIDVGPVPGSPFDTQATLYYSPSGGTCDNGFTCISSTSLCGEEHQDCFTMVFTMDGLPDSMRVFGVEGGGNPVAGCYPNPDMLVIFPTLPIRWGDFSGVSRPEGNLLSWNTLAETNNDHFEVLRARGNGGFENIGEIGSQGNGTKQRFYSFTDAHPLHGESQYKIRQVDANGQISETDVIVLSYTPPQSLAWNQVGPVPTSTGRVQMDFLSEKARTMTATVIDTRGQVVVQQKLNAQVGLNALEIDLSKVEAGMYFLRLAGADGKLDYKLMKL